MNPAVVVLAIVSAWGATACAIAVLLGRSIKLADERAAAQREWQQITELAR